MIVTVAKTIKLVCIITYCSVLICVKRYLITRIFSQNLDKQQDTLKKCFNHNNNCFLFIVISYYYFENYKVRKTSR